MAQITKPNGKAPDMSLKQKSNVLGACDYARDYLLGIKKAMMDVGNPKQKMSFAIGGMVIMLTSSLVRIIHETLERATLADKPDAIEDLKEIRERFNKLIDDMINHE